MIYSVAPRAWDLAMLGMKALCICDGERSGHVMSSSLWSKRVVCSVFRSKRPMYMSMVESVNFSLWLLAEMLSKNES